jgi:hypothetical protein
MKQRPLAKPAIDRPAWMLEVEPYFRTDGKTLSELREDLRLKKLLRRAVNREVAPLSLIESIRAGIRA